MKAKLEALPKTEDTLQQADNQDVLALDGVWSYVKKKSNKAWI